MKTYSLDADIVADIVETVAEKLELFNMDMEQRETLTEVVALAIALYFQKLNPDEPGMLQ